MLRQPAVAGHFYHASAARLKDQVEQFLEQGAEKVRAIGILSPHAGLIYSGSVAGAVYSRIELPDTFVLIGPNHTGLGSPVSIMTSGEWTTPLGSVKVDETLSQAVLASSSRIEEDMLAHLREHSLEVQLPFIQHLKSQVSIVPIQMMDTRFETCVDVGNAVAKAISGLGLRAAEGQAPKVLIIASSDMSHYVDAMTAKQQDQRAIERILDLDARGLYDVVKSEGITMCGCGPAVAMLTAGRALGATRAELVKYATSGEVSGDYQQVVGYAGMVVY